MKTKIVMALAFFLVIAGLVSAHPEVYTINPGESITEAIFNASYDDIIELADGIHSVTETVEIPLDLTIRGAEGATAIWDVPASVEEAIHVSANVHFYHIIFRKDTINIIRFQDISDASCIRNIFGEVINGNENEVKGNNIYVDYCQFIGFYKSILLSDPRTSSIAHPVDTLSVTNCLFYGAHGLEMYPRAIHVWHRQCRNLIIQDCTFWHYKNFETADAGRTGNEAMHINGYGYAWDDSRINTTPCPGLEYMKCMVDHCTFHFRGHVGIFFEYPDGNDTLSNNVFQDISGFALKGEWCSMNDCYIDFNIAHPDLESPWQENWTNIGTRCRIVNPMFENPDLGDFRYKKGSPCIGYSSDRSDCGSRIQVWKPGTWDHTPPVVGVEENVASAPTEFRLNQNYPNPFNPRTSISYSLEKTGLVVLNVYTITGKKIRTLINEIHRGGAHSVVWDGLDDAGCSAAGGIYFYRLQSGSNIETRKMVLIR